MVNPGRESYGGGQEMNAVRKCHLKVQKQHKCKYFETFPEKKRCLWYGSIFGETCLNEKRYRAEEKTVEQALFALR